MRLHASNFGIQFLSHNIKIFNSYKPFSKLENRVFILKIFDAEESIVPPPIRDRIILRIINNIQIRLKLNCVDCF